MKENNDKDTLAAILGCLLAMPFAIVIVIASTILDGWAVSRLWAWFIVPLGLPTITIAHAIGVGALFGLLKSRASSSSKDQGAGQQLATLFIAAFLAPLLAVGIGWIVLQFM